MVHIITDKYKRTKEMKKEKVRLYAEMYPEQNKIIEELHQRKRQGKPTDGRCYKDAGVALQELRESQRRHKRRS